MHVGTPPGYAIFFPPERVAPGLVERLAGEEMVSLWASVPDEAKRELADYYAALHAGRTADRVREELPCLWLDPQTRRCRHYEHRPVVCRDFEVGGEECLAHREARGIGRRPGERPRKRKGG
jgi:Fe-S-cluster containining protein